MAKIDIYSFAKDRGYQARDIVEALEGAAMCNLTQQLRRMLTEDEKDEFTEGFWNGVV